MAFSDHTIDWTPVSRPSPAKAKLRIGQIEHKKVEKADPEVIATIIRDWKARRRRDKKT